MATNSLLSMPCGGLSEADQVFCKMLKPAIYRWNAYISSQVKLGSCERACQLYDKMQQKGINPDRVTFLCVLKACSKLKIIEQGRLIHQKIVEIQLESDISIGNSLLDMYAKCGSIEEAQKLFDELPKRSVVSWGAMISGYALHGHVWIALDLFEKAQLEGMEADCIMFTSTLKACAVIGAIEQGKLIHGQIVMNGFESDVIIGSTIIDMYAKCGSVLDARQMFDGLQNRDAVSWGAIMVGYAQCGHGHLALDLFGKMVHESIKPGQVVFLSALKACGSIKALGKGRLIHNQITKRGLEADVAVGSAIVDMYVKCWTIREARIVFDGLPNQNVVSWGAIIAGYAQCGLGIPAFGLFRIMQKDGIEPDKAIFSSILKASGDIGAIGQGSLIHNQIISLGLEADLVLCNTLVEMYSKCGRLEEAQKLFNNLTKRDVKSWGAIIAGFIEQDHEVLALEHFEKMQQEDINANKALFLCILKACWSIGSVIHCRTVHDQIIRSEIEVDLVIGNAIIDMYAKCGSLDEARKVFDELPKRDNVSWGTIIGGYAQYGDFGLAETCFEDMNQQCLKPDNVIFTSILTACSHAGHVEVGLQYFMSMMKDYSISPILDQYNCIIDLLSRSGYLNEAADLIESMPVAADIVGWRSLLSGCKTYGNMELGRQCFDGIARLHSGDAAAFVLMSNVYANAYMWEDFERVQDLRKDAGALKRAGRSWTEANNKIHEFIVGDRSHPHNDKLLNKLSRLRKEIKEGGCLPSLDIAAEVESSENKEHALWEAGHNFTFCQHA